MGLGSVRAAVTALRPGPNMPVRCHRSTHLIVVEAATPKRRAAERRDTPLSTADTSHSRYLVEWPQYEPRPIKFWFSSLPVDTPLNGSCISPS